MGLRTRRVAGRAGSNLGHFPDQFEPNSTTLYIIRSTPAHRAGPTTARAHTDVSLTRAASPNHSLSHPEISPHWKFSAWCRGPRGGGTQSAGRTCANKIDFLSPRWRFVTSLFTSAVKCGHWIFDGLLWRHHIQIYSVSKIFHYSGWDF